MENNEDYMDISELLEDLYPDKDFYYIENFDDAIVGIVGNKLVYSKLAIIDILCYNMEMNIEDALKYYEENIENGYYGEKTPIFLNDDILNFLEDDFPQISPN